MRSGSARSLALMLVILAMLSPSPAEAQGRKIIRDAEIENIIRAYATPLFQAAGLSPQAIDVFLIEDRSLNAFVAGGLNLFVHTGLLMATDDPLEVIGVIAHETGHLAGGHIAGRIDEARNAGAKAMGAYLLGLGAAVLTGQPGLGAAIISGGQDIALKGLLKYTRSQEQAADQAAIRLLNGTEQSPRGLLEFMRLLGGQEVFLATTQDPYLSTHPVTQERVTFLEHEVQKSRYADAPARPEFLAMHRRMRAKLVGFLEPLPKVLKKYRDQDESLESRYARAIAYFRRPDLERSLPLIDGLIADWPDDPYFHELRGQILFENGRAAEALPNYEKAVHLLPTAPQLRLALAQVQIELNDSALDNSALGHLKVALDREPENAFAWRLAATAYGRRGDKGMTSLALAEGALARGSLAEARDHASRAQRTLPEGSPGWLRAQDLENFAKQLEAKKR